MRHRENGRFFVVRKYQGSQEAYQALLGLKSDYLPQVFETAEKNGNVIALEKYIEGDSVSGMLESNPFTADETRRIAMDVCKALYTLHGLDIIHRDVKPENIILREDKAVFLDFDAARIAKEKKESDTLYYVDFTFENNGTDIDNRAGNEIRDSF